mmetsp:Transcript_22847/g.34631  ORF Transcript_22847/g.34631 Transcript_22847/m.34631 type:complete len:158 (+) Transcript_22847:439-912(+)
MTPVEFASPYSEVSASQSSSELVHENWNAAGDDLTEYSHHASTQQETSWQEEAHWMSFRSAVQMFALLKTNDAADQENEEKEKIVKGLKAQSIKGDDNSKKTIQCTVPDCNSSSSDASESALAADLAETRMRLALAQAERDELEFVLLRDRQQHPEL